MLEAPIPIQYKYGASSAAIPERCSCQKPDHILERSHVDWLKQAVSLLPCIYNPRKVALNTPVEREPGINAESDGSEYW